MQIKKHGTKFLLTGLTLFFTLAAMAQTNGGVETENPFWVFSNTLFNVLLGVIILLLIVIGVLASVLSGVGEITLKNIIKKGDGKTLSVVAFILFMAVANPTMAQTAVGSIGSSDIPAGLFYLMLTFIGFEILVIIVLIACIKLLIKKEEAERIIVAHKQPSLMDKLNASVAIEKESDIMMDHNYDGIRELDNDLPPWWKYGFYVSIVAAFIYLLNYHITKTGDLQIAEYNKSVVAAKVAKEEYEKINANNVNESNVKMLTDGTELEKGKTIFQENCFACHGKQGQGGVGPNLTDDYWLHGGNIKDIFKSIKYGWPDKGMKSWQSDLSPMQINEVASFIKTLRGTNPVGAKEKQGELYVEEVAVPTDSLIAEATILKVNSVKVK